MTSSWVPPETTVTGMSTTPSNHVFVPIESVLQSINPAGPNLSTAQTPMPVMVVPSAKAVPAAKT